MLFGYCQRPIHCFIMTEVRLVTSVRLVPEAYEGLAAATPWLHPIARMLVKCLLHNHGIFLVTVTVLLLKADHALN